MSTTNTNKSQSQNRIRQSRMHLQPTTPELQSIIEQTFALFSSSSSSSQPTAPSSPPQQSHNTEKDDPFPDFPPPSAPSTTSSSSSSPSNNEDNVENDNTSAVGTALRCVSVELARDTLQQYLNNDNNNDDGDNGATGGGERDATTIRSIPLNVIHATKSLLHHYHSSPSTTTTTTPTIKQLQNALSPASTLTTSPTTPSSLTTPCRTPTQNSEYQKRLSQLRLLQQERQYTNLTSNIDYQSSISPDATVKSMMYATSIGANMIVAPVSFGVFMFFFCGSLFDYWSPEESRGGGGGGGGGGKVDVRKVIVGVLSGVLMLFIEMILFVIRNHEMDRYVARKMKKDKKNPFGYVKSQQERTFVD